MNRFVLRRSAAGLIAALVATTAITLVAPAPASAAVLGLEFVGGYTSFDSQVYKSVTVTCPPGKQVVGTGFAFAGASGSVVLDDLIPTATTLTVGAGEVVGVGEPSDGTPDKWEIYARALCVDPLPGLEIIILASWFGPGGERSVTAACPREKKLVGAGASLKQGWGQISIDELDIAEASVTAHGVQDEDGFTGSWSITAYAICADPIPGLTVASTIGTGGGGTTSGDVTTFCPQDHHPLGGGWGNQGTWAGQVYVTGLSAVSDGRFTVRADEDANGLHGGAWYVVGDAICVPSARG